MNFAIVKLCIDIRDGSFLDRKLLVTQSGVVAHHCQLASMLSIYSLTYQNECTYLDMYNPGRNN